MVAVPLSSRITTARRNRLSSQCPLPPSMVIIPASPANIVETVSRVTGIALFYGRSLACGALRNHAEMLHIVARRRPVAFGAVPGIGRGMPVALHAPAVGRV